MKNAFFSKLAIAGAAATFGAGAILSAHVANAQVSPTTIEYRFGEDSISNQSGASATATFTFTGVDNTESFVDDDGDLLNLIQIALDVENTTGQPGTPVFGLGATDSVLVGLGFDFFEETYLVTPNGELFDPLSAGPGNPLEITDDGDETYISLGDALDVIVTPDFVRPRNPFGRIEIAFLNDTEFQRGVRSSSPRSGSGSSIGVFGGESDRVSFTVASALDVVEFEEQLFAGFFAGADNSDDPGDLSAFARFISRVPVRERVRVPRFNRRGKKIGYKHDYVYRDVYVGDNVTGGEVLCVDLVGQGLPFGLTFGAPATAQADDPCVNTPVPFHVDVLPGLLTGGIFLGLRARKRAAAKAVVAVEA